LLNQKKQKRAMLRSNSPGIFWSDKEKDLILKKLGEIVRHKRAELKISQEELVSFPSIRTNQK